MSAITTPTTPEYQLQPDGRVRHDARRSRAEGARNRRRVTRHPFAAPAPVRPARGEALALPAVQSTPAAVRGTPHVRLG